MFVLAHLSAAGESWVRGTWATRTYPTLHPLARAPQLPTSLSCVNGILAYSTEHSYETLRSEILSMGQPALAEVRLDDGGIARDVAGGAFTGARGGLSDRHRSGVPFPSGP